MWQNILFFESEVAVQFLFVVLIEFAEHLFLGLVARSEKAVQKFGKGFERGVEIILVRAVKVFHDILDASFPEHPVGWLELLVDMEVVEHHERPGVHRVLAADVSDGHVAEIAVYAQTFQESDDLEVPVHQFGYPDVGIEFRQCHVSIVFPQQR